MTMHWPQTRQASSIALDQAGMLPEGSELAQSMALMGVRINFPRNAEIYGESEPAEFVYLIISGTVRTSKILAPGSHVRSRSEVVLRRSRKNCQGTYGLASMKIGGDGISINSSPAAPKRLSAVKPAVRPARSMR